MTEWDIQPRAHACTGCHQPFADKQDYHTLLAFGTEGYLRRDLCGACYQQAGRDGVLSYWQGEYKLPPAAPAEAIQKDTAETLLRKLVDSTDPAHAGARYIFAVMLERKRLLKHRDTVTDEAGNELLIYEHVLTNESFTVPDPHLHLDQLQEVQQQVADILQPAPQKTGAEPVADSAPANTTN